jgi:hypothetical protein
MCHMLKWLPLLSTLSLHLHSSTQCSSMQKRHRHSCDPVLYNAEKATWTVLCWATCFSSIRWPCIEHHLLVVLSFILLCSSITSCGLQWSLSKMSIRLCTRLIQYMTQCSLNKMGIQICKNKLCYNINSQYVMIEYAWIETHGVC